MDTIRRRERLITYSLPELVAPALVLLAWALGAGPMTVQAQAPTSGASIDPDPITLEMIGITAAYGLREEDGRQAVLQKPLDAAFLGPDVLVLDASAPWVRVFDRNGQFVRALVGDGEGPGEVTRPMAISAGPGGILVSHSRGIEHVTVDGALIRSVRRGLLARGAVECGGDFLALVEVIESPPQRTIMRLDPAGTTTETVVAFGAARERVRSYHPWFASSQADRLLVYTEEADRDRLVEMACDGTALTEIPVEELGRGEVVDVTSSTTIRVTSPSAPFPSGLARVHERILWVTRELEVSAQGGVDSVTVVTSYTEGGPVRRLSIHGWYQLFDSDPDGWLLFGNSWTYAQVWSFPGTWGFFPAVFLVDGAALLQALDDHGVAVSP